MQCMITILFCVLLSFTMKLRLMVMSTAEGSLQSQNRGSITGSS